LNATVDREQVELVKTLTADVRSELECVLTDYSAVVLNSLIDVSRLAKVAGPIISEGKSSRQAYKWNPFELSTETGMYAELRIGRVTETLARGNSGARILD
jgi:hypothetical protein